MDNREKARARNKTETNLVERKKKEKFIAASKVKMNGSEKPK